MIVAQEELRKGSGAPALIIPLSIFLLEDYWEQAQSILISLNSSIYYAYVSISFITICRGICVWYLKNDANFVQISCRYNLDL
jgi:hypothetical protein